MPRGRRNHLTPDEKTEALEAVDRARNASVAIVQNVKIGSPEYVAAGRVIDAALELAKILTGDERALLAPLHESGKSNSLKPQ
jgi:hypothetical protein